MDIATRTATTKDSQLVQILDHYLEALQAGKLPEKEEILAQYPELADDLEACLASLEFIRQGAVKERAVENATGSEPVTGVLGDYRMIREIGRGGMGVVYEAQQVSLGRRVALKVLPFAGALDPKQLQRFKNEAQAAAHLHHTNIVPVFGVGCERGVHYYAMQYIEGQTLAEVIAELRQAVKENRGSRLEDSGSEGKDEGGTLAGRQPRNAMKPGSPLSSILHPPSSFFRTVANLGIQGAGALEHAHELGVVHRDIKPANLLVDLRGNLWITDFGLAHCQHQVGLTMTGDLVGTLRYMSPEQALAKRASVDHRTDVYSLGVTLYELLTLEPAFSGNDREVVLRQIAFEEPRAPRQRNKAIPRELETIVLKALEKSPERRYATAQELADDLRRFLEDKPIHARRPTLVQRAGRWSRRHRAVVWAATVVAIVVAFLGTTNWVWWAQKRVAAEREVELAFQEATRLQEQANWPEALSAARRAEGLLASGLVSHELQQRVRETHADLKMVNKLEDIRLKKAAVKDDHFDFAGADPDYAQAFRKYGINVAVLDPTEATDRMRAKGIGMELAAALDDWADVCRHTREKDDSTAKDLLAIARAVDPDPWRNKLRDALERGDVAAVQQLATPETASALPSSTLVLLGETLAQNGHVEQAVVLLRNRQRLQASHFWINHDLGKNLMRLQPPQLEEAIRFYSVALALRPQSPGVHLNLGDALMQKGALDDAIAVFQQAVALNSDYSMAYMGLGIALARKGRLDEAIAAYKEAIRLKSDYAEAHVNLGVALKDKRALDEAIAAYHEAIRLQPKIAKAYYNLGNALMHKGALDEAVAAYREAIHLKPDYAAAYDNLGIVLTKQGQLDEAIDACKEAILKSHSAEAYVNLGNALIEKRALDEAIAAFKKAIRLKPDLVQAHVNLGNSLQDKGAVEEAVAAYHEAIRLKPEDATAHYGLGNAFQSKGGLDQAIALYHDAIRFRPNFAEAFCNLGQALEKKGRFTEALVARRRGHELGSRNPGWRYPSARWVQECERLVDLDGRLPAILGGKTVPASAGECIEFAKLCSLKHLYAAGARFYQDAFAVLPELADDVAHWHRYNAACQAARAGCGQGEDTSQVDEIQRTSWRRQALEWLRSDLTHWANQAESNSPEPRLTVQRKLEHWRRDSDLSGVRDVAALATLPAEEQDAWRRLWTDVEDTLIKSRRGQLTGPKEKSQKKP
jgi:tetratricopeptide (TPR) repeat protein